jgi:deoxyribonuclease-4
MAFPDSVLAPPRGLLGAHTSIAGGTHEAPPRAHAIAATAMQMFTKQANRWAERDVDEGERDVFRVAVAATQVGVICAHDSYLINLASPDETLRRRSIESFVAELRRCEVLGLDALVSHPGNFMDDRASGVGRNADAISEALERVPGRVRLLMETTAGSGTAIGATFEELAELIARVPALHRPRLGVCVDTAHVFAAGYDLVRHYDDVWQRFGDVLGFDRLGMMHLNDSKVPLGSRRDRHELIGEGAIGEAAFRRIMTDERLATVPKVIETPKLDDAAVTDRWMLDRLRAFTAEEPTPRTGRPKAAPHRKAGADKPRRTKTVARNAGADASTERRGKSKRGPRKARKHADGHGKTRTAVGVQGSADKKAGTKPRARHGAARRRG